MLQRAALRDSLGDSADRRICLDLAQIWLLSLSLSLSLHSTGEGSQDLANKKVPFSFLKIKPYSSDLKKMRHSCK